MSFQYEMYISPTAKQISKRFQVISAERTPELPSSFFIEICMSVVLSLKNQEVPVLF